MKINKTAIDARTLNLELLNKAREAGLLSVLITEKEIRLFMPGVIVVFSPLSAEKTPILAQNLRGYKVPFAAQDKALKPTLGYIPAEHLAGQPVVAKVYPPAQPATRPVVKAAGAPAPVAEAKVELPPPAEEPAKDEPAPKEKKKRAPRAKKNLNPGVISPEEPAA